MSNTYRRHLRQSQIVTTFGPGAIIDLRDESVMIAGLEEWPSDRLPVIREPNLERLLKVRLFRSPPRGDSWQQHDGVALPIVLFPEWMVCPGCQRLAKYTTFVGGLFAGGKLRCSHCKKQLFPARLVVACDAGHIDDFPWSWWVHEGQKKTCNGKPALKLFSVGRSATLGDLIVKCEECGNSRSLSGATFPQNLEGFRCTGRRPWLLDLEDCDRRPIPLQRGASNVYFSKIVSSISIPPWSRDAAILQQLQPHTKTLKAVPGTALEETIAGLGLPEILGVSIKDVIRVFRGEEIEAEGHLNPSEIRYQEHLALRTAHKADAKGEEFVTRKGSLDPAISEFFAGLINVEKLREVRALIGFDRVSPPNPSLRDADKKGGTLAKERQGWFPAIDVHGEGLYFELDEDRVTHWAAQDRVLTRAAMLNDTYVEMCQRNGWEIEREITPRLLLVHGLAHALMRQLALDSGYASASLRERLYAFEPAQVVEEAPGVAGVLIYTSTTDSEGSLGGLVRQGEPDRFRDTVLGALEEAQWCASDPLCSESEGQGPGSMNLAACHNCMLVSETSCEEFNRLLDRAMLVGLPVDRAMGFFQELLEG